MMDHSSHPDLQAMLSRAIDGSIAADEFAQLEELLLADPAARAAYQEHMRIHALLYWRWNQPRTHANESPETAVGGDRPISPAAEPSAEDIELPGAGIPVLSRYTADHFSPFVGEFAFSYMVASIFVCLLLLGFWAYKLPSDRGSSIASSDNSRRSTTSGEASPHDRPAPVFVGRITGIAGAKWSDAPNYIAPMGVRVALGRTYKLKSGLMEITYDSGAKVILEGPCSYEVDSTAGGYLALGKLVARVGAGGEGRGTGEVVSGQLSVTSVKEEGGRRKEEGDRPNADSLATSHQPLATNSQSPSPLSPLPSPLFTVRTPTAIVTDLGTEFGVDVRETGATISHVFQGVVVIRANGAGGGKIILCKNESAKVEKTNEDQRPIIVKLPSEAKRFVKVISSSAPQDAETYSELVLSLKPVIYYRMERSEVDDPGTIADSAGGHSGKIAEFNEYEQPYRAGRWGDALRFRGAIADDAVVVPDYPKATEDKLTVSAWVTAEKWMVRWPKIVSNWGNTPCGQFNLGLFDQDADLAVRVIQRDGTRVTVREGRPFPFSQWQHVAFSIDGTVLRLYRNGAEVARAECRGIRPDPSVQSLVIGGKSYDDGQQIMSDFSWRGIIDELAVFNEALSLEDIRWLYEGRPTSRELAPPDNRKTDYEQSSGAVNR